MCDPCPNSDGMKLREVRSDRRGFRPDELLRPDNHWLITGNGDTTARDVSNRHLINVGDTTQVDSHPKGASWVGALNMAGNVWEWVSDWYAEDYSGSLLFDLL